MGLILQDSYLLILHILTERVMFPEITLSAFSGLTHIDFSVPANSRYVELDIKGIGVNDIIISKIFFIRQS